MGIPQFSMGYTSGDIPWEYSRILVVFHIVTMGSPLDIFWKPWEHYGFSCVPMRSHAEAVNAHWKPMDHMDSHGFSLVIIGFTCDIFK